MEKFVNCGPVKNFNEIVTCMMPVMKLMKEQDLTQYGFRGRTLEDGTISYGEGKTISGVKLTDWTTWRPGFEDTPLLDAIGDYATREVGRIRLMRIVPFHCYSWHRDLTPRLHIPLVTVRGAFIAVGDQIRKLTKGDLWWVDTTRWHTAFNGGTEDRYHLVYEVQST